MNTVCHTEGDYFSYPEVTRGCTDWVFSDARPKDDTVRVTCHGLRRLLRLAARAQTVATGAIVNTDAPPEETRTKLVEIMREASTIWCEGDLVMSRLFVDDEGNAIAHCDKEVDEASIPPWEKEESK